MSKASNCADEPGQTVGAPITIAVKKFSKKWTFQ
jgi:hypothetical protein